MLSFFYQSSQNKKVEEEKESNQKNARWIKDIN
jgi:uncharacterized membrane protein YkgB